MFVCITQSFNEHLLFWCVHEHKHVEMNIDTAVFERICIYIEDIRIETDT